MTPPRLFLAMVLEADGAGRGLAWLMLALGLLVGLVVGAVLFRRW